MKYFKVFNTEQEYYEYLESDDFISPNVSTLRDSTNTWINPEIHKYKDDYLTFVALEDGTFTFTIPSGTSRTTHLAEVSYSIDNGETWTTVQNVDDEEVIITIPTTIASGNKVLWKGRGEATAAAWSSYSHFSSTGNFNVEGNAMSMLFDDNFATATTLTRNHSFLGLFVGCTKLISTENLVLPATTIPGQAYEYMFSGCTSLTTAIKELPCQTMQNVCYYEMFKNCTSLTTTPTLPATTLANQCYQSMFEGCTSLVTSPSSIGNSNTTMANSACTSMFKGCTSLTTAPSLPATTLAVHCYRGMFQGCTSLTTVPSLPATTLANNCYQEMFRSCKNITTAPELPATTLADNCYDSMFEASSLTTVPQLAATTLTPNCYFEMFRDCTSLTTVPSNMLPATTLATNCYNSMFAGCTGLTTTPVLSATTLAQSCYYNMFKNCKSLTTASVLPATTLATNCYNSMYQDCTSLTTVPSNMLPATTLATNCYYAMFRNTRITSSPVLPSKTLVENCYQQMFYDAKSLNHIDCYATDISASNCTTNWVQSVSNSGTFVKYITMEDWTTGSNGIPTNWIVENYSDVHVTGVTLNTTATTITKGGTTTLVATVSPNDAGDKSVTWSSNDTSVATVSSEGVITAVGCGEAIITVTTTDGGCTAQCTTTVENPVTGVSLNTNVLTILTGLTYQLEATVSPSDACGDKSVTWSSSDSTIATVSNNGLVTAVATGSAVVTVTTTVGSYTASCAVEVSEPVAVTGVTLNKATLDIFEAQTEQLVATVLPNNATNKNVTWSSNNSNIATVDSNGIVSAVTTGSAIITVTTVDGGYTASCEVTVSEQSYTSVVIEGASSVSAETCEYRAVCDNVEDVTSSATWSITAGSQYATINPSNGHVTILNGANESSVTIQVVYGNLTGTSSVTLTYISGAASVTTSNITTDIGGNSTSVVTTVTTYADSSSTEVVETIVTDVNGDLVGSSESTKTTNADGSYEGVTTNYDANGDKTDGANITGDTEGNVSTQTVEYDDSGNTVVTGYDIDTSGSESGKEFMSGGTNTEYYAFDLTHGFKLDIDFTIDFANQPPGQSDSHHNILTAKRASPEPWYGFQIRHSQTNNYIQLGTQFETGSNINTTINPSSTTGSVGSYSLRIVYDPNSSGNKFVCTNMATGDEIYSSTGIFPDLEELKYLRITIGNATDGNGNPFRYSNITVSKFELKKLKYVDNPTITYEYGAITINCSTVGASIYYRLNLSGSYSAYTTPITITADTVVQAYATYSGDTSDIIREDFEIVDVTGVTLSDNSITIGQGRTYTLTATVLPNDALDKSVTWSSSDNNVASVDSSGVVSGVASGSATVTVTTHDGGYTAQCAVSVSASPYTELEYIESTSTGGQYIDLDIKLYETLNAWYDIAIKYNVSGAGKNPEQPTLFGCQTQSSPWPGTFIRMNQDSSTNTIGRYIGGTRKDNTLGNNNTDIELPVQTAPNRNVTNLNNGGQTHNWGTSLFCAFSDASGTPFRFIAAKLYYFKLFSKTSGTSQGTLIRDMMPCKRNSDNAIGLLDKVNNVFYTNPSGDAFVAGPVVNS